MPTESGDVTALAVTGALGTATLARTQPGVWTYAAEGKGARPADPRRVRALLRRLFPLPAKRVLPVEPIEMAGPPAFTARVQEGSRATTLKWWTATFDGTSYYARTDRRTTPVLVDADVIDRLLRLSELV
jgi:hypothetical protein